MYTSIILKAGSLTKDMMVQSVRGYCKIEGLGDLRYDTIKDRFYMQCSVREDLVPDYIGRIEKMGLEVESFELVDTFDFTNGCPILPRRGRYSAGKSSGKVDCHPAVIAGHNPSWKIEVWGDNLQSCQDLFTQIRRREIKPKISYEVN